MMLSTSFKCSPMRVPLRRCNSLATRARHSARRASAALSLMPSSAPAAGRSPRTWRGRPAPPPGPRPALRPRARERRSGKRRCASVSRLAWIAPGESARPLCGSTGSPKAVKPRKTRQRRPLSQRGGHSAPGAGTTRPRHTYAASRRAPEAPQIILRDYRQVSATGSQEFCSCLRK